MRQTLVLLLTLSGCKCAQPSFGGDEAARVCLTLQTCAPREFGATYGNSVEACAGSPSLILAWPGTLESSPRITTGLEQPFKDLYRCLLEARGDCAKANACWAIDGEAGSCTNPGGLTNGRCDGETLSGCTFDRQRFQVNCARYSATCTDLNFFGSVNLCATAKCPETRTCRGEVAEICSGSALLLWDCRREGRKCEAPTDGGNASCVAGDTKCSPAGERHCEGTVAVGCEGLGLEVRTDCAQSPTHRRCEAGDCVDTGSECHALMASCEGDAVKFCQDGFLRKVDCKGAGFGGCDGGQCVP